MTQQPFSRPGAIDLSALKRPAAPATPAGEAPAGGLAGAYTVTVDEQSFQGVLEASMHAPVVLAFFAPDRSPETAAYAEDVAGAIEGYEGRFLCGLVDVDATPQLAQAMQIPTVPLMLILLDGRPVTQPITGLLTREEIDTLLQTMSQQLTAQGITQRHQPRSTVAEGDEDAVDPRYAPAQAALEAGDIDAAVAEYKKLVDANPADVEAAAGLAMARVLQRTRGVDLTAARTAAAENPDDVDAQTLVADLDLLGGHVDDAFNRLVGLVARTSGDERAKAREHLIGLFAAVGNEDPRVLRGRQNLASALF
ncbi:co-chaperone YbbN [Nocardioides jiangxiensis]|uniref:Tetratricopeptide repeat protein n=1 Tax=Nocardioides jiangxiensis TaxID=3064524 RepID=A0ABT9AZ57_9ACTN|nr:tetratricopeptide repeat protein [Nocardioides sp. WY-20]MDO7867284.1 tetratricopeptide repeat protein [Nocardioides sp. WY-20]